MLIKPSSNNLTRWSISLQSRSKQSIMPKAVVNPLTQVLCATLMTKKTILHPCGLLGIWVAMPSLSEAHFSSGDTAYQSSTLKSICWAHRSAPLYQGPLCWPHGTPSCRAYPESQRAQSTTFSWYRICRLQRSDWWKHKAAIRANANDFFKPALPTKAFFWNEAELREKCAVIPEAVISLARELSELLVVEAHVSAILAKLESRPL